MRRFHGLRKTNKKIWFGTWILALAAVLGVAQWRYNISEPIRTQVLGASVKSTPAPTITSGPSGATASTSAAFAYSDSEKGVAFLCALDTSSLASCPSGGMSYSGLAQGAHTFRVQAQGISPSPVTTRSWTVDTVAPAAPRISAGQENPTIDTSATFTFSGEPEATFQCTLDGAGQSCTSPYTYKKVSVGDHTFTVTAIDAAGNRSPASAPWAWSVLINKSFGISGNAERPVTPGGSSPLNLTISNPYNFPIRVVSVVATVKTVSPGSCDATNSFSKTPVTFDLATPVVVPANSARSLASFGYDPQNAVTWPPDWPTVAMRNIGGNQDVCKNATFTLSYTGTASKS